MVSIPLATVVKPIVSEKTVDCPRDTDGDGDCGRKYCPICGKKSLQ